jgi:hypothetical protein
MPMTVADARRALGDVAPQATGSTDRYQLGRDCLFLLTVVILSLCLYVSGLGSYSDDWAWLSGFTDAPDRSVPGLFLSTYWWWDLPRPLQILYYACLYWLFGLTPSAITS